MNEDRLRRWIDDDPELFVEMGLFGARKKHLAPAKSMCWICLEEIPTLEIGGHYRTQSHKASYSHLLREINAYWANAQETNDNLCGGCPALIVGDYVALCRFGWFGYHSVWQRNLFGYYNPETGDIEGLYPQDRLDSNLDYEVTAIRAGACRRQIGGGRR